MTTKEKIKELFHQNLSTRDIAKQIGLKPNTVSYHLTTLGLTNAKVVDKTAFKIYFNKGWTDAKIAKKANCSTETVRQWRIENGLSHNFSYETLRKFDYNEVEPLIKQGLLDQEIASLLNVSESSVYRVRTKIKNIHRQSYSEGKPIAFTHEELEVILGTVMGDASLYKASDCKNPRFSCEHGIKQKEYCKYKHSLLKHHGFSYKEYTRSTIDARTGIYYKSATCTSPATPSLWGLYRDFYETGVKCIPIKHLDSLYTPLAMAIHFMDDGSRATCGYMIATQSFNKSDVLQFTAFLKSKYDIECTVRKNNDIYIPSKSKEKFTNIIYPYIIESMKYKIWL